MQNDMGEAGLPPDGSTTPGLKEGQETLAEVLETSSLEGSPDRDEGLQNPHTGQHQSQQSAPGSSFTPQLPPTFRPSDQMNQAAFDPAVQAAEGGMTMAGGLA